MEAAYKRTQEVGQEAAKNRKTIGFSPIFTLERLISTKPFSVRRFDFGRLFEEGPVVETALVRS